MKLISKAYIRIFSISLIILIVWPSFTSGQEVQDEALIEEEILLIEQIESDQIDQSDSIDIQIIEEPASEEPIIIIGDSAESPVEQIIDFNDDTEPTIINKVVDSISNLINELKKLGITIINGVITAVKLVVNELVTGALRIVLGKGQDNVIGSATFPVGAIEYRVKNSLIEENSRIFVSFTSDTGGDIAVEPLDFDYWIVLVEEDGNFDMGTDVAQDELTEEEFIKEFQEGELELLSQKTNFRFDEELKFRFKYKRKLKKNITSLAASVVNLFKDEYSNIIIEAKAIDPYETTSFDVMPQVKNWGNGEFSIDLLRLAHSFRGFQPGKYKLKIRIEDNGKIFIGEQDFYWGVLAINTNKSIYLPGEKTYIQIAVLDDTGDTICDAFLNLEITNPRGKKQVLTTSNRTIQYSGECGPNNVTNVPDYIAYHEVQEQGIYHMKLTATTIDGINSITDSFEVREQVPFDVERIGPTRIYPLANYNMRIRIRANQDFKGDIFEFVPASFEIVNKGLKIKDIQTGDYLPYGSNPRVQENENSAKRILWENIELKQGDEIEIQYVFDAPDISPYLYLLGPLQIGDFYEARHWQIASDSPNQKIEQQINIVSWENAMSGMEGSYPTDNSWGLIYWDADKYNGETVYFEAIIFNAEAGNTASASLYTNNGVHVDGSTVTTTNNTRTLVRTASPITLTDDTQYTVRMGRDASVAYLHSARLIILQNATSITDTVTQIEVGCLSYSPQTTYSRTAAPQIYYYYDNDVWDPPPTVYFEATLGGTFTEDPPTIEGPQDTGTGAVNSSVGTINWNGPGNIASEDAAYAITDSMSDGDISYYILASSTSGFDAIPDNATITGIEVDITRREAGDSDDYIRDMYLHLIKNGDWGLVWNGASTGVNWDNITDETITYGDAANDKWGFGTWSPSEIKDESGFGVAFAVEMQKYAGPNTERAQVNNIEITVGWTFPAIVTSSAALYTTGGTYVTEVELASSTWDEYQLVRTSNSFSLSDNTEYEVRMKTTGNMAHLTNSKIILEQSGTINELEIIHQYVNDVTSTTNTSYIDTEYDNQWDPGNWDEWSYAAYFEATLWRETGDATGYAQLRDITTPADIANTEVSNNTFFATRKRSSEIYNDLPSTTKTLDTQMKSDIGTVHIHSSWLIIQLTSIAVDEKDSFFLVF
jgi:hypothetical protein